MIKLTGFKLSPFLRSFSEGKSDSFVFIFDVSVSQKKSNYLPFALDIEIMQSYFRHN